MRATIRSSRMPYRYPFMHSTEQDRARDVTPLKMSPRLSQPIHFCRNVVDNGGSRLATIANALEHRDRRKTCEPLIDRIYDEAGRLERCRAQKRRDFVRTKQHASRCHLAEKLDLHEREFVLVPSAMRELVAGPPDRFDSGTPQC